MRERMEGKKKRERRKKGGGSRGRRKRREGEGKGRRGTEGEGGHRQEVGRRLRSLSSLKKARLVLPP